MDVLGRAERQRLRVQPLGVDLQQREIGRWVLADDRRLERLLVGELHSDRVGRGAVDHVVVGEDVAAGIDDEARAGGLAALRAAERVERVLGLLGDLERTKTTPGA